MSRYNYVPRRRVFTKEHLDDAQVEYIVNALIGCIEHEGICSHAENLRFSIHVYCEEETEE